jgi:hypothetical protein
MLDERQRRLARNLAIALVLAGCSAAQYAAVSKAATFRVLHAGDSLVDGEAGRGPDRKSARQGLARVQPLSRLRVVRGQIDDTPLARELTDPPE